MPEKNIKQKISRNGEMLKELLEDTDSIAINMRKDVCQWTREHRRNASEKSVIDYVIVTQKSQQNIKATRIDVEGTHRLKGKEETDHNTILMETDFEVKTKPTYKKVWKKGSPQDWQKYNDQVLQEIRKNKPTNYDEFEAIITKSLEKNIGQITIKNKPKTESKDAKEIRTRKKEAEKKYDNACKEKDPNIQAIKDEYISIQKQLIKQLEKDERTRRYNIANKLIREGGTQSDLFWKLRRKIIKNDSDANYDVKDEEGNTIEDEEEAKEHIANYYENLYQARPGTQEYEEWTRKIQEKVSEIEEEMKDKEPIEQITMKELNTAIKVLKKGKSCGPDNIPNEAIINANHNVRKEILLQLNSLSETFTVPNQWQEGEIKRLYKGKGIKGKCSAERGITLASNIGKLYERIINNRALKQINITDAQAGGRKGRATVDHLLITKEIIQLAKVTRKPLYIVFLDVTKAYDKAWLDAIMYVMNKEGITTNLWTIIRKLNQNLTARVRTKDGLTRSIQIKDSIRQGGVLSVAQYALLMDEISKELDKITKGVQLPETDSRVADLLWVDDVALFSTDEAELQTMLDTTDQTAKRYRIEFGKEKSKVLRIGKMKKNETAPTFNLGPMKLDYTEKYSYLGETINERGNIEDHIKAIKGKVEAAYQTIRMIAGDRNLNIIDMETTWKLIEACVLPIILYAADTWNNNKEQTNQLNRILDNIIKRTIQTPTSTPREALYMETGMLDTEHAAKKKQLLMKHRIQDTASDLMKTTTNSNIKGGWKERTEKLEQELNLQQQDYTATKSQFSKTINEKVNKMFHASIEEKGKEKSKIKHLKEGQPDWEPGNMKKYLMKLPKREASTIFRTKTRMIKVKSNFKNMYKNNLHCRACGQTEETQEHVLNQCRVLHTDNSTKVTRDDLFDEDLTRLRKTASRIETTLTLLETHNYNTNPADNRNQNNTIVNSGAPTLTHNCDGDGTAQRPGCTR